MGTGYQHFNPKDGGSMVLWKHWYPKTTYSATTQKTTNSILVEHCSTSSTRGRGITFPYNIHEGKIIS
jgi:hypothetical protein